jgi:hypothetical protein
MFWRFHHAHCHEICHGSLSYVNVDAAVEVEGLAYINSHEFFKETWEIYMHLSI